MGQGQGHAHAVVIVSDDAQPATASALLAAGFTRSPFAWIEPTSTTSVQVGGVSYPVLLYVHDEEHPVVRGWLASRDHWRANRDEADRYAQVKRAALAAENTRPGTYQRAKSPYLEHLARQLTHPGETRGTP